MKNLLKTSLYFKAFLLIYIVCVLLLLGRLAKTESAIGGDAVHYYITLRSIVVDKDLKLDNEYEFFHNQISSFTGNRKIPTIPPKDPRTDKLPSKYPIGTALFLAEPFLITHLFLLLLQNLGLGVEANGYNLFYQGTAALASLSYAFLGILLIYQLGKRFFEPKVAFLGSLAILFATPLIYYMTMESLTSQPLSFFSVSLFIYLWLENRTKKGLRYWVILGLVGGLMATVRYQDSLFLLLPLLDNLKKIPKVIFGLFSFLLFAGIVIMIQLYTNNYFYGSPLSTGIYDAGFPYLTSPKILYTLFSLERGLFVWSPILVFAMLGLYWFIKKFRSLGLLLLFSFLIQVYIVSSWTDPTQGDSFGNRILLNSNIIFALGLMQFLKTTKINQKIILGAFALLVLLNIILAGLFVLRLIGQPY